MTTAASATSWLAAHIGNTHRLYALDPTHIRCKDCQQTGVLPPTQPDPLDPRSSLQLPPTGASQPPSRRGIPHHNDPDACKLHVGQWALNCGPCRSETLADEDKPRTPATPTGPRADPRDNPEWQALREKLRGQT